jgi:phosphoglycolate phosphatase
MIEPTKIRTVLFDLDGTLVDSRVDLASAVHFALKATGQPHQPDENIIPHVGNGLRVLLSEVLGPVEEDVLTTAIAAFEAFYDLHCVKNTVLYENVLDCLKELHENIILGVVTNKPVRFAEKIIRGLNFNNFISVIVGGDSLPERKPHPAPLLKAVTDVEGSADTTLIVGDGAQDIMAGQAAGVRTCIARYGYGYKPDFLDLKPDYYIDDFREIKEIVL